MILDEKVLLVLLRIRRTTRPTTRHRRYRHLALFRRGRKRTMWTNEPTSSEAIPLILSGTNVEETSRETSEKRELRQTFVVRKRTGRTVSPVRHPTLFPPSASTCAESEQPTCDTRDVISRPHAGTSSRQQSVERSDGPTLTTPSREASGRSTAPDVVRKLIPLEREFPRVTWPFTVTVNWVDATLLSAQWEPQTYVPEIQ